MRFLLYNIRYGAGADPRFHMPLPYSGYFKRTTENLDRITDFIRSVHPDIVGLVEVDNGSFRSKQYSQPALIARALGHYHIYRSKYPIESVAQRLPLLSTQGNALLTSKEIKAQKCHYFSKGVKRLVIEIELKDLTILLVHLSVKFRDRHYQLSELYSLIQAVNKPVLVAGDFNLFGGIREVHLFLAATGLKNANMAGKPSYPSWAPRRQLDFILHSPEIRVISFQVPRVPFSDHLPLLCDFEVAEEGRRAS